MSRVDPLLPVAADDPLLDQAALRAHLAGALNWDGAGLRIEGRFPGGNANICFALHYQGRDYVLRRPPAGKLPPKSHDMGREFRILRHVHPQFPLAPQPVHFCEDAAVLGAPFLLMDRRRGIVLRDQHAAELARDPARNAGISRTLVKTLVRFHQISPAGMIEDRLGRPDGFVARQWQNWSQRTIAQGLVDPAVQQISGWLAENLPPDSPATVVHNDYKLDNLMMAADDWTRPVALLDWDLCSVGDPLFDLGILLTYWVDPGDPQDWRLGASMPTYVGGFLTRREVAALYGQLSGRSLERLPWYLLFANFRVIVALSQIYDRYLATGQGPAHFAQMGERIGIIKRKCLHLMQHGF